MEEEFESFIESYGCIASPSDFRDYIISASESEFPSEHILSVPKVKNQSIVSSCVAHTLSSANEFYYQKESGAESEFSAGFIYGYRPPEYYQGKGMFIRDGLQTLINVGNVPDYVFPYNEEIPKIKKMVDEKLEELKPKAEGYKISKYARLDGINEIKTCLLNGLPVVMSIPVYKKAFKPTTTGTIEAPKADDVKDGSHAIFCYGWTTINGKEYLLILNSWGIFWGKAGKANLSVKYPINEAWGIADNSNSPIIVKPKYFWLVNLFYELKKLF